MKIIACLGNPGNQYRRNRHNVGFLVGDYIKADLVSQTQKKQCSAEVYKGIIFDHEAVFLYPQTYMNNSGKSVAEYIRYTRSDVSDLIVLHDELELSFGDVSLKSGGGHKGHNGIRSIIAETGSSDFKRIRLGIGRPQGSMAVADYVLSDFSSEETERLEEMSQRAFEILRDII